MINIKAFTKRILKNVTHNKKSYQIEPPNRHSLGIPTQQNTL